MKRLDRHSDFFGKANVNKTAVAIVSSSPMSEQLPLR
jgi:hypothetical protein